MRLVIGYVLIGFLLSCNSQNTNDHQGVVVNLNSESFLAKLEKDKGVVLDVRTKEEVVRGSLIDASFIDFYDPDFLTKASWIKKNQPIYVYCHAGGRSSKAAEQLLSLGFRKVFNLVGVFSNWKSSGYPIKKGLEISVRGSKTYSLKEVNKMVSDNINTLLVFKTPWCLPCKKLDPVLEKFKSSNESWNVLVLNMDTNPKLSKSYGVTSVPTIIAFKNGVEFFNHIGYIGFDLLKSYISVSMSK